MGARLELHIPSVVSQGIDEVVLLCMHKCSCMRYIGLKQAGSIGALRVPHCYLLTVCDFMYTVLVKLQCCNYSPKMKLQLNKSLLQYDL